MWFGYNVKTITAGASTDIDGSTHVAIEMGTAQSAACKYINEAATVSDVEDIPNDKVGDIDNDVAPVIDSSLSEEEEVSYDSIYGSSTADRRMRHNTSTYLSSALV